MKIKRILFSFVLVFAVLFSVACKDKNPDESSKADPVVIPKIEEGVFLVGDSLKDIEILLGEGSTSGTISWVNENYTLVDGLNNCAWKFVPNDKSSFNEKTGSSQINARRLEVPQVSASIVEGQTIYIDAICDRVELEAVATFNDQTVDGEIVWLNPERLVKAQDETFAWKFIPTDSMTYATVTGSLTFKGNTEQEIVGIGIGGISKTEYIAYDKFDKNSLTLCWIYNADKIEEIDDFQALTSVRYNDGESLKRGDESVVVSYSGYEVEVTGLTVDYKLIDVPEFGGGLVYDGYPHLLTVASSQYYSLPETDLFGTNADDYDLTITLKDPDNCKWANGDEITTNVICTILKADILVDGEISYEGEYDTYEYNSLVISNMATKIYYSETEITDENYLNLIDEGFAVDHPIKKADAGEYVIYYYLVGDENHNGKSGSLSLKIYKQTPIMMLEHCYTLATGSVVNYPLAYAKLVGSQSEVVEGADYRLTYYTEFVNDLNPNNDVLTVAADGALTSGGAPKNARVNEYYVKVEFLGNNNYNPVSGIAVLYIDGVGIDVYAKSGETGFAFKSENDISIPTWVNSEPDYMIDGTNHECNTYVEFNKLELDANGLIIVKAVTKFRSGSNGIKDGRLVYSSGSYKILDEDGEFYTISYNSDSKELSVAGNDNIPGFTLKKWEFPNYLNTYSATTIESEEDLHEKNSSQETTIKIYNDYGTIRFSVEANVVYTEGKLVPGGGGVKWAGVAEIGLDILSTPDNLIGEPCYFLDCYLIVEELSGEEGLIESEGYAKTTRGFRLAWPVTAGTNPTSVSIVSKHGTLLTDEFADLMNFEYIAI